MNSLEDMRDMLARVKSEIFHPGKTWVQKAGIALEYVAKSTPHVEISGPANLALSELKAYEKVEAASAVANRYQKFIKRYIEVQENIEAKISIRDTFVKNK